MPKTWREACRVDDLTEDVPHIVAFDALEIGLIKHRGTIYALRNRCTHAGAPLCKGRIVTPIVSDGPGQRPRFDHDAPPAISCPWHHWRFDLATGRSLAPVPKPTVRTYETKIDDGWVYLCL